MAKVNCETGILQLIVTKLGRQRNHSLDRIVVEQKGDHGCHRLRITIVPGEGVALLRAIGAVEHEEQLCEGDDRTGVRILKRALETPARQIAENSGVDGGVVVDRIRNATGSIGFDAAQNRYTDLIEAGIIDPTKVVRIALENAVSVAGTLLLTEATMTDIPEKSEAKSSPAEPGFD